MKRHFTLLFAAAALITTSACYSQNVPSYVPTSGLVGWWPFNGNANDESGNGNNGTVNGATLSADRNGNSNSAYFFNVSNWSFGSGGDHIYIPYNPSFNFSEFTISSWVNRASLGSTISPQSLSIIRRFEYGYSNPNGESWILEIAHGTNLNGSLLNGYIIEQSPSPAPYFYCGTTQVVAQGQWTHILMTYSQSTINLYMNGQLVCNSSDSSIIINTVGNSGISVGLSVQANGHWAPFDGEIDDIGIWNRALTPNEITSLYNSNSTSISEINSSSSLAIYPNPTSDVLNVKSDAKNVGSTYRIMDVAGRIITTGIINSESMTIDMGQYASGMYLLIMGDRENSFRVLKN